MIQKMMIYTTKPFDSWVIDESKWQWKAPKDYPDDGKQYEWDEPSEDWKEV